MEKVLVSLWKGTMISWVLINFYMQNFYFFQKQWNLVVIINNRNHITEHISVSHKSKVMIVELSKIIWREIYVVQNLQGQLFYFQTLQELVHMYIYNYRPLFINLNMAWYKKIQLSHSFQRQAMDGFIVTSTEIVFMQLTTNTNHQI